METVKRRRNKSKQKQAQDVSADSETSDENSKKSAYNHGNDLLLDDYKPEKNVREYEFENQKNHVGGLSSVERTRRLFRVNFEVDLISIVLLLCGFATRMFRLEDPRNIV